MSIGGVGSSPVPEPLDTTVDSEPAVDTSAAVPAATPAAPGRPAIPTAPPRASDIVPAQFLRKYGLDPDKMTTESRYDGPQWNVGYYPYSGDVQYMAFAKHGQVYGGDASNDAHAWFEFYSNPPSGLSRGSWIAQGSIRESDFERTSGVDVTGDRPISNDALKLLRECGAPARASFALRDASGHELPIRPGDRLVPTVIENGRPVETEPEAQGNVVWRLKGADGVIRYDASDRVENRYELAGAGANVKFDFLDATGELVPYDPTRGDRIVAGYAEGDAWHVFAKGADGSFEHQVVRGGRRESSERLSAAQAESLMRGKDVIYRVQDGSTGALRGDGKVQNTFDMGWWGKCHNVASIGTSNMPRPKETVRVVTNAQPGDTLALEWGQNRLVPERDASGDIASYWHETRRGDGALASRRQVSVAEANELATANSARPILIGRDGSVREARVSTFSPRDVDALVSHIGDGAVIPKGGEGARYYAHPDILVLKDGRQVLAHIESVVTAGGKTEKIGERVGTDFAESDRAPLRGPGMSSRVLSDGSGRQYAFNIQDMAKLNEYRSDDIVKLNVVHPDGTKETIDAAEVELFAWENKYDFRPDQLWNLHKTVGKDGSTVIEQDPGPHVWNYTINSVDTTPLKPESLSRDEKERAKKPGMMTGTVGEDGKYFFETHVNYNTYRYWVKFAPDGKIEDYGYLTDSVPDFVWTQHVKNPWTDTWTGESQAPGIRNADIQRTYVASLGGFKGRTLPGGFLTADDLKNATPRKPENI
jgi:hypothetical protein